METLRDQLMDKLNVRPKMQNLNTKEARCQGCSKVFDPKLILLKTALHNARHDVDFCDDCVIGRIE